jgi:polar amino acid transport system ATP-binding protein
MSDARAPILRVERLSKSFAGSAVLHDVSFDVHQGERICIIGPSGSGKSTLLRCINQLDPPDFGSVSLDGVAVAGGHGRGSNGETIRRLRLSIGMVFQSFNLWPHMTVLQNLMEAPVRAKGVGKAEARQISIDLLRRVGLADKHGAYPTQLSGGQQQRVAIARALAMNPRIMLFDEPTSSLDPELVREVLDVMKGLARDGMTMLVVTHELRFAADVGDRIFFMDRGRILEDTPAPRFFAEPTTGRASQFLANLIGVT